jgi:hypothetical protein
MSVLYAKMANDKKKNIRNIHYSVKLELRGQHLGQRKSGFSRQMTS